MSKRLDSGLPATLLFDHPSLRSVAASMLPEEPPGLVLDVQAGARVGSKPLRQTARGVPAVVEVIEIVSAVVLAVQGTIVAVDRPLVSAGLDSIAATELANALAKRIGTTLPSTLLFDHPTISAAASFVATITPAALTADTAARE